MKPLFIYLIVIAAMSVINLIAFAADKKQSGNESNGRIPEIVLLSLTSFGGAAGAMIGMYVLRHKTNPVTKFHFAITAWLSLAVQVAVAIILAGGAF